MQRGHGHVGVRTAATLIHQARLRCQIGFGVQRGHRELRDGASVRVLWRRAVTAVITITSP